MFLNYSKVWFLTANNFSRLLDAKPGSVKINLEFSYTFYKSADDFQGQKIVMRPVNVSIDAQLQLVSRRNMSLIPQ